MLARFLDAVYPPTRPSGEKEGVLVAWGSSTEGKRVLVAVRLGQRESHEDWLGLFLAGGRGLGPSDLEYREVVQRKIARGYPDQAVSKVA